MLSVVNFTVAKLVHVALDEQIKEKSLEIIPEYLKNEKLENATRNGLQWAISLRKPYSMFLLF